MNSSAQSFEADLLRRVVDPERAGWSREAASSILSLGFTEDDKLRATALAEKASSGEITEDEQREIESFRHVARLLELMKSRARLSLKALSAA